MDAVGKLGGFHCVKTYGASIHGGGRPSAGPSRRRGKAFLF